MGPRRSTTTALMALLESDTTLGALVPGGVHLLRAPQNAVAPYVVVRRYPGRIIQSLGAAVAGRYMRFSITARVPGAGSVLAEQVDERIHVLLSDVVLTLDAPFEASSLRRVLDIDEPVIDEGVEFDQVGGMYEMFVSGGTG